MYTSGAGFYTLPDLSRRRGASVPRDITALAFIMRHAALCRRRHAHLSAAAERKLRTNASSGAKSALGFLGSREAVSSFNFHGNYQTEALLSPEPKKLV